MTVSESTKQAEGLGSFFKFLGRISAKAVKKLATNVLKIQGELWELLQTAAATKSPKAALSSLPEVITFYHTGKGSYLGNFVWFYTI